MTNDANATKSSKKPGRRRRNKKALNMNKKKTQNQHVKPQAVSDRFARPKDLVARKQKTRRRNRNRVPALKESSGHEEPGSSTDKTHSEGLGVRITESPRGRNGSAKGSRSPRINAAKVNQVLRSLVKSPIKMTNDEAKENKSPINKTKDNNMQEASVFTFNDEVAEPLKKLELKSNVQNVGSILSAKDMNIDKKIPDRQQIKKAIEEKVQPALKKQAPTPITYTSKMQGRSTGQGATRWSTSFQQLRAMKLRDRANSRKNTTEKPTPPPPSKTTPITSPTMSPRLTEEQRRERGIHPTGFGRRRHSLTSRGSSGLPSPSSSIFSASFASPSHSTTGSEIVQEPIKSSQEPVAPVKTAPPKTKKKKKRKKGSGGSPKKKAASEVKKAKNPGKSETNTKPGANLSQLRVGNSGQDNASSGTSEEIKSPKKRRKRAQKFRKQK